MNSIFDKIKRRPIGEKCHACGVKFEDHRGLLGTCAALQTALETLRGIAATPRNRQAKAKASACVQFLETQIPELRK